MNVEVKVVDGGWEVKLGAGILPILVTAEDINLINALSGGTVHPVGNFHDFMKLVNAVNAVNKYEANKNNAG